MLHLLGFLLILVLMVIVIGLTLLSKLLGTLFGWGRKATDSFQRGPSSTHDTSAHGSSARTSDSSSTQTTSASLPKKRIFGNDEGEYVDFEEIKE